MSYWMLLTWWVAFIVAAYLFVKMTKAVAVRDQPARDREEYARKVRIMLFVIILVGLAGILGILWRVVS